MEQSDAHLELVLDLSDPVEIEDFARLFAGLGAQFDSYLRREHPDLLGTARLYVKDVRQGSIIAELWAMISGTISGMDQVLIVRDFGRRVGNWIKIGASGRRIEDASKTDLKNITDALAAVAHDRDGHVRIFYREDGPKRELIADISTREARDALNTIEEQRLSIENASGPDYSRVLMTFERSSISSSELGKRSGERVVIEDISSRPRPLIYATDLAAQRIKSEIRDSDDNPYKKAFVVDVNVQLRDGKPWAYRVTHVHQVLDIEEEA